MDWAAIVVAAIALLGTLVTALGPDFLKTRSERHEIFARHRDPLVAAAGELQSRIYNILGGGFGSYLKQEDERGVTARETTLYAIAQYFGWQEILRREITFLTFEGVKPPLGRRWKEQSRETAVLVEEIREKFASDRFGHELMVWRVQQRAIGEAMISAEGDKPMCIGPGTFTNHRATMKPWLEPLERDLFTLGVGGERRLRELQPLLLRLVKRLDPDGIRHPSDWKELSTGDPPSVGQPSRSRAPQRGI